MKNNTEEGLLYITEHISCPRFLHRIEEGFVLKDIPCGDIYIQNNVIHKNYIIAILSGSIELKYEQYPSRIISAGEIFTLSRSSIVHSRCVEDSRFMILYFEVPATNCEKLNFQVLKEMAENLECDFNVLPIKPPLKVFFSSLAHYLEIGANCEHLHAIKLTEMFLCLRYFYRKEELAALFAPMLYKRHDFRHFVLENYERVASVHELVELAHMSKTVFFEKFKAEFGVSAKQWVLAKKVQKIEYKALEPDMTVKKLMAAFDFDSLSSFQRFCKQHLGCSPTELIDRKSTSEPIQSNLTPI